MSLYIYCSLYEEAMKLGGRSLKRWGRNLQAIYLEVGAQGFHVHGHASEASVHTSAL